jgi:hypothetical protein
MQALIKAQNGQLTGLYKLAPELKKNKGNLDDFAKSVKGAAMANADPFSRLNVAVDNLKEQFGRLLLPAVIDFTNYVTETVVPAVKDFLDQVGNPKTDAGKTFYDIKKAVQDTFKSVSDFFALFGNGDAMKGFGNVASALVKMLPALLALKGIMVLASAGKTITNLVAAMTAIRGGGGTDTKGLKAMLNGPTGLVAVVVAAVYAFITANQSVDKIAADARKAGNMRVYSMATERGGLTGAAALNGGAVAGARGQLAYGDYSYMSKYVNQIMKSSPTIVVNSYGSTPGQFTSLVVKALDEHNRLNGKKP